MSDFIDIVEQARDGAPAGQRNVQLDADTLLVELVVRPAVGMAFLTARPMRRTKWRRRSSASSRSSHASSRR